MRFSILILSLLVGALKLPAPPSSPPPGPAPRGPGWTAACPAAGSSACRRPCAGALPATEFGRRRDSFPSLACRLGAASSSLHPLQSVSRFSFVVHLSILLRCHAVARHQIPEAIRPPLHHSPNDCLAWLRLMLNEIQARAQMAGQHSRM